MPNKTLTGVSDLARAEATVVALPKFSYGDMVELDPANPKCAAHAWVGLVLQVQTALPTRSGYDVKVKTEDGSTLAASEVFFRRTERNFTPPRPFELGEVVVHKGAAPKSKHWTYKPGQWFVVTKQNADTVTIVKLGGEGNRYWRVPPSALQRVDVSRFWDEEE